MSTDTIEFSCASCGSKEFKYPENPKPDDMITCNGCGAQDTYAAIQAAAIEQAKNAVSKVLGDSFKGLK